MHKYCVNLCGVKAQERPLYWTPSQGGSGTAALCWATSSLTAENLKEKSIRTVSPMCCR